MFIIIMFSLLKSWLSGKCHSAFISATLLFITIGGTLCAQIKSHSDQIEDWQEGFLDIHHINTGRGDATFIIFPDGTTLLVDAGDMNPLGKFIGTPMRAKIHPDSSKSAPEWIVDYIKQFHHVKDSAYLDYVLITHFHGDHYGELHAKSKTHESGKYKLTGITEVGSLITIKNIIDRGYPNYEYPVPLKSQKLKSIASQHIASRNKLETFNNYLEYIKFQIQNNSLQANSLKAGSKSQISLQNDPDSYPGFFVRNIKSNGFIWSGESESFYNYFPDFSNTPWDERPSENPLSNVIKINYGKFNYYTGGDSPGITNYGKPFWFDVETPIAKAVGEVDVAKANHHGNRDCCNVDFVGTLKPRVWILSTWSSDHPGGEVFRRLTSRNIYPEERDLFAINILDANKNVLGPSLAERHKSTEGHILIRVFEGGEKYHIYTLNDENTSRDITGSFGPYSSK